MIYRLEKGGAIENYHIIFSIPNFLRRETEGKATIKINLLLAGEYSRKINKESGTLNRKH